MEPINHFGPVVEQPAGCSNQLEAPPMLSGDVSFLQRMGIFLSISSTLAHLVGHCPIKSQGIL